MPGLAITYVGSRQDVIDHLTGERDEIIAQAGQRRLGQIAKAKLDGKAAGLDQAIALLSSWTGDGEAG